MAISSYSNPIPEIIDGLLRGHQLGLQMQQAARADQEFKTQQAMHNQQMSINDIMNTAHVQGLGRPVTPWGTVQGHIDTPSTPFSTGGDQQPQGDLYNLPTRPGPTMPGQSIDYQAPLSTVQNRLLTPSMPISPGNTVQPDVYNLPQKAGPAMPGQSIDYERKADKSRVLTYPTLGGQKVSVEQYTPEEVQQRAMAAQLAGYHAQEQAKLEEQIKGLPILRAAQARIDRQQAEEQEQEDLRKEGGGTPAPPDFARLGIPPGKPITSARLIAGKEQLEKMGLADVNIRKGGLEADELQRKFDLAKNTNPQDYINLVDQVVPLKDGPALNMRTKAQVNAALKRGDFAAAQDAIKQASAEQRQLEVATDPRVAANKIHIALSTAAGKTAAEADAAGLTPDDYARSGEQYGRTGIMPSMGRDKVTRTKIEHAKNEWARENGFSPKDLVLMQAGYKGDLESLKKFQAQRDQTVSFEQTATKNLDLMLAAGKRLTDTGSRLLNQPLRSINRNLLSTDEQAAFDAAQLIARNEVAKVTSGGGMSGVVSDSSRHEMEQAMGKDPTIGNMIAVANILKADMANRHGSMDQTLSDIRSNIGGGRYETPQQGGPPTRGVVAPIGGTAGGGQQFSVTDPRGVVHQFANQKDADAFKQAAGIR